MSIFSGLCDFYYISFLPALPNFLIMRSTSHFVFPNPSTRTPVASSTLPEKKRSLDIRISGHAAKVLPLNEFSFRLSLTSGFCALLTALNVYLASAYTQSNEMARPALSISSATSYAHYYILRASATLFLQTARFQPFEFIPWIHCEVLQWRPK